MLVFILAACNDEQPPTQNYVVLSPTPDTSTSDATEDPSANNTAAATATNSIEPVEETAAPTARPTRRPTSEGAQATQPPTSGGNTALTNPATATPAPEMFPTNTVAEVPLAEQVFEHGRMFWIRHSRQIWVMVASEDNENAGDWYCYNDTFEEGEEEIDPSLIAPEGMYQPRRGFGKLWREHQDFKDALGWAITPEFELTSNYTYIPGGYMEGEQYLAGPGEHRLTTLYNDTVSFFEGDIRGDCQGGTWRIAPAQ
jgi:hypothetical protein